MYLYKENRNILKKIKLSANLHNFALSMRCPITGFSGPQMINVLRKKRENIVLYSYIIIYDFEFFNLLVYNLFRKILL